MSVANRPIEPSHAANDELRCPLCDYDLRGLTEHRCPECGHAFDPAALRAAKVERLPWLFEHAKRRRLPIAFVVTTIRTLNPVAFWRGLNAAHQIERLRLTMWAVCWTGLACVVLLFTAATHVGASWSSASGSAGISGLVSVANASPTNATPSLVDAIGVAFRQGDLPDQTAAIVVVLVWPMLAMGTILLFGQTLQAAGVERGHLLRCTRYAMPSVALPVLGAILLITLFPDRVLLGIKFDGSSLMTAMLIAIVASSLQLAFAYAFYLRLPQAVLTALMVVVVVWLTMLAAGVLIGQKN